MAEPQTLDTDHRALGVALFNDTWRLLEKERTPEEDDQLLHQAHASTFHWLKARECEIAEANPESMEDFDLPFAYEALARAQAVAGDRERSESYDREARAAAERIADPEDREVVLGDLATI